MSQAHKLQSREEKQKQILERYFTQAPEPEAVFCLGEYQIHLISESKIKKTGNEDLIQKASNGFGQVCFLVRDHT